MNAPGEVHFIMKRLRDYGHEAWLVGGCVRDFLMDKQPKDYDIATSAEPAEVMSIFPRVIPTGIAFGTVTVLGDSGVGYEVTTYRVEQDYTDGRRPDRVEFVDNIGGDLARRDLTINAIAYDPLDDRWMDPFSGREDIDERLIKAVGDPMQRFMEDRLRVLRAIRFSITLDFFVHPATAKAMSVFIDNDAIISDVAVERVTNELTKIMTSNNPKLLEVFMEAHPKLQKVMRMGHMGKLRFTRINEVMDDFELRMAYMLSKQNKYDVEGALRNLKLPRKNITTIVGLTRMYQIAYNMVPTTEVQARKLAAECVENGVGLHQLSELFRPDDEPVAKLLWDVSMKRPPVSMSQMKINGTDLAELGIKGKAVGWYLKKLLERVIEDPDQNYRGNLMNIATELKNAEANNT